MRLPAFTGWGYSKDLAAICRNKTFRERFRKEDTPSHVTLSASEGSLHFNKARLFGRQSAQLSTCTQAKLNNSPKN
jgi:hypothetical protein